jgi:Rps23 Pro-64 3,4-dihydroxylase Tpa1-like proline 4-hydroxylase
MFNPEHDAGKLNEHYRAGDPFPNIVLDNFFDEWLINQVADELEVIEAAALCREDLPDQVQKLFQGDLTKLPPATATALRYFNSPQACTYFAELTGIPNLLPDPSYIGGGVHITLPGGHLGVHADFNLHPVMQLHRRVNALLFLNREWQQDWGGQFEMWPTDLSEARRTVDPILNRLAVFSVTDKAFHGVPRTVACPPGRRRLSLALYYYTKERPEEEKGPFHGALFQQIGPRSH